MTRTAQLEQLVAALGINANLTIDTHGDGTLTYSVNGLIFDAPISDLGNTGTLTDEQYADQIADWAADAAALIEEARLLTVQARLAGLANLMTCNSRRTGAGAALALTA